MARLKDAVARAYLTRLVGEDGLTIVEKAPKGEATDEKVAEVTGVSLNTVRRALYILYENGLASYRRERDKDSGWLTYLWKIDLSNIYEVLDAEMRKLLKILQKRLETEKNSMFYACVDGCGRFLFELAAGTNFVCPICGATLEYQDNTELVKALEKRVKEIQKCTI
ncbi:MAG: transcription factor E [Methanocellales archaeon]|nr:transcription factor E [Methanocellales archaeon]